MGEHPRFESKGETKHSSWIRNWKKGSKTALGDLFCAHYHRLRDKARYLIKGERAAHSLTPSDLLHSLYLRLVRISKPKTQHRNGFVALCGKVLRNQLVDHARKHKHRKVGLGDGQLDDLAAPAGPDRDVLDLQREAYLPVALDYLNDHFPHKARIICLILEGKKGEQLYAALGKDKGYVDRHRATALKILREEIMRLEKRAQFS